MVALLPPYLKSRHLERQQFSTLLDTKVRFGQIYNAAVNVSKRLALSNACPTGSIKISRARAVGQASNNAKRGRPIERFKWQLVTGVLGLPRTAP